MTFEFLRKKDRGRVGKWRDYCLTFLILFSSISNSFASPLLLVNKGEINIHDSVQKVGHSHYKSNGGRVRYWSLGAETAENRQGKAIRSNTPEARGFQHGMTLSADSIPIYPQQNNILRRESGFKPSQYPYRQGPLPSVNSIRNPETKYQNYDQDVQQQQVQQHEQQPVIMMSTTIGYVNTNTNSEEVYEHQHAPAPLPSITYDNGGQGQWPNGPPFQFFKPRQSGLKKLMVGLKGKFNKAMSKVKSAFKTMMFNPGKSRKPQRGVGRNEFGTRQGNPKNPFLELDVLDVLSPMRRLYRWFSGRNPPAYN